MDAKKGCFDTVRLRFWRVTGTSLRRAIDNAVDLEMLSIRDVNQWSVPAGQQLGRRHGARIIVVFGPQGARFRDIDVAKTPARQSAPPYRQGCSAADHAACDGPFDNRDSQTAMRRFDVRHPG
jgi:hypothetical protein